MRVKAADKCGLFDEFWLEDESAVKTGRFVKFQTESHYLHGPGLRSLEIFTHFQCQPKIIQEIHHHEESYRALNVFREECDFPGVKNWYLGQVDSQGQVHFTVDYCEEKTAFAWQLRNSYHGDFSFHRCTLQFKVEISLDQSVWINILEDSLTESTSKCPPTERFVLDRPMTFKYARFTPVTVKIFGTV